MLSIDSLRQVFRTHPWKVSLVAIAAILYIGFNVWVYNYSRSGAKTSSTSAITETIKSFSALGTNLSTPQHPTPTPTPTLKTGPGPHGCDPYGVCNLYSPEMLKENCTVTFADSDCLGQCTDRAKRCKK